MSRGDYQKLYTTDPLIVLQLRDLAVQLQRGDEEPFWLPFSQIIEPDEQEIRDALKHPDGIEITIAEWLARDRGLF